MGFEKDKLGFQNHVIKETLTFHNLCWVEIANNFFWAPTCRRATRTIFLQLFGAFQFARMIWGNHLHGLLYGFYTDFLHGILTTIFLYGFLPGFFCTDCFCTDLSHGVFQRFFARLETDFWARILAPFASTSFLCNCLGPRNHFQRNARASLPESPKRKIHSVLGPSREVETLANLPAKARIFDSLKIS